MLEMNARSLQQKLESERDLKQRLLEEVRSGLFTYVFAPRLQHVIAHQQENRGGENCREVWLPQSHRL